MKKVIVAMSGGVDSAVAAFLLQQQGWEVTGVFMKNWEDTEKKPNYRKITVHGCTAAQDYADMRLVCQKLHIPYRTFNFVKEYRERVFKFFLTELRAGRTPNPDIMCNQEIKFRLFLEKALQLGSADKIATGHYARLERLKLRRPKDRDKDQTYFLYRLNKKYLPHIIFPLAGYTKKQVRAIAKKQGLANWDKKDSTGICFIGDIDYREFIQQHIKPRPGVIQTASGKVLGRHQGLYFYTIGQRQGINIGGTGPYYVLKKDMAKNILIVTNDPQDKSLFQKKCVINGLHWLIEPAPTVPFKAKVQIRYRQTAQTARLRAGKNQKELVIEFTKPQRAITPGQSAVLYQNNCVLGGGIISRVEI